MLLPDGADSTLVSLVATQTLTNKTLTSPKVNENVAVTSTATEINVLDGITAVVGELNALDIGSTAVGTAVASKAVILDSNKDYTGIRNLTISGELDAATLDISGAIDIAGASQFNGTVTVGVDDTGHDVKFFGASAGAYFEWDESADQLRILGASADATTSTGKLLLATALTDINANDVMGKIDFQAPLEAGGTDAITIAASIQAVAQATFSSSVNSTDLLFFTGHSEAATEKFRFTSQGEIGIAGNNVGTDGQVLTSGGAGAAAAWEDAAGGGSDPDSADGDSLGTASAEWSDLFLADGAQILFGNDQEITLTHVADVGLTLTHVTANDNLPIVLQLKSSEDAIIANEVLGSLEFAAGDSDGTDGATVAAGIHAIAEGTFSASANATKLAFTCGVSETAASSATAKMTLSSAGLLTITDDLVIKDGGTIGLASDVDLLTLSSASLSVAGALLPGTDDTFDLGSPSFQWRNIYTGDLHLSNMSKKEGNMFDGTKGDWTIQEGADELYLKNNNSGKKYKFNLTEI